MLEFRAPKLIRKIFKTYVNASENYIEEIEAKQQELLSTSESIKSIVLGSSHGAYGFNPSINGGFFNLCSTSQDLYYSYNLYKYCSNRLNNLNSVILFYSVFSPGFELQHTIESQICAYFKLFYDIDYKTEDKQRLKLYFNEANWIIKKNKNHNRYPQGYLQPSQFLTDYPLEKRVKGHLRENRRENNQHDYLEKLIELTKENKHKLYIVIPPARSDYRENLPSSDELFKKLYDTTYNKNIQVMDFYNDEEFNSNDFGDFDHLNQTGSKKLTNKIYEILTKEKNSIT